MRKIVCNSIGVSKRKTVDRRSVELYFQMVSDKALSKGHRLVPIQRGSKQPTIGIDSQGEFL